MTGTLKNTLGSFASSSALSWLFRPLVKDRATIFMFHRFLDPEFGVEGHNPILLRRALADFRKRGFRLVPLMDLLNKAKGGEPTGGMIAFTVDDGYGDFHRVGGPIFASMECPVTVFLATGFLDRPRWYWWDRLRFVMEQRATGSLDLEVNGGRILGKWHDLSSRTPLRRRIGSVLTGMHPEDQDHLLRRVEETLGVDVPSALPERFAPMTWDQVRENSLQSVTFGPHTVTHRSFGTLTRDEAKREISGSWRRVKAEAIGAIPVFCFPFGGPAELPPAGDSLLLDEEMEAAVTTVPGHLSQVTLEDDPFRVPRFSWPDSLPAVRQVITGVERAKTLLPPGRFPEFSPERR